MQTLVKAAGVAEAMSEAGVTNPLEAVTGLAGGSATFKLGLKGGANTGTSYLPPKQFR